MAKKKKDKKDEDQIPSTFMNLGSGTNTPQKSSSSNLFGAAQYPGKDKKSKKFTDLPKMGESKSNQPVESNFSVGSGQNAFSTGADSHIISTGDRTWYEILADTEHWTPFPFSIGLEMELIIANDQGDYIEGEEIAYRMVEIVKEAKEIMNQLINYEYEDPYFPPMPQYIRSKLDQMAFTDTDEEKGLTMNLSYLNALTNQPVVIQVFGRDGNVTSTTYILELVTPICIYVEELAYWASTLFQLAKKTLPKDLHLIASAMNPAIKEYTRGLSHGDHNHIGGFQSDAERAQCYDIIRNFIPHIIALSVNSPIINNEPTDVVKTRVDKNTGKTRYAAPNCVRSLRLKNNTTMLSGNDPNHYIPYLMGMDERNKQHLLKVVQKMDWYDARYQDVFPLTDFGTIEIRIMDAQISICRRIGLAMLNEALCYKARKLLQNKKYVPNVTSETITFNRKSAIERGLIAPWKGENTTHKSLDRFDPNFAQYYLGPENQPHKFLFQAVQGMFHYIKDELKELGFLYSPFLKPVLQSVFGSVSYADVPITEAEYQLSLYDYKMKNGEIPNVLNDLIYFTLEYSKDPLNNPLTGQLTLPDSMR